MSIRVYSLVANGAGTVPTLQEVCEQGATTDTGISFIAAGSSNSTIVTVNGLTTSNPTTRTSVAVYGTGVIQLTKTNISGLVEDDNIINFQKMQITSYSGANKDTFYQDKESAIYYKFALNFADDVLRFDSGNGTSVLPSYQMRKRQGGGTSIVQISPTASSNEALSYLPFDTTNNASGFQIRNTLSGTVTLVAGIGTVTNSNIKSISIIQVTLKTPGGVMGINYKIVLAGTTFTITAVDITGAPVLTDTSVLDYLIQF
jgi:hypothetical protein